MNVNFYYASCEGITTNVVCAIKKYGAVRAREDYMRMIEDPIVRSVVAILFDEVVSRNENWLAPSYERRPII